MTENQKTKDEGWVNLSTKVPPHIGKLFDILAEQRGMKSYELLQLLVNGFISSAKHSGPMTPEIRLLLDSLKLDVAFNKAFNFASPTAQNEIAQMVLILQQPDKKGFGLMMIDRPFMGDAMVTYCVDTIMERITEVGMEDLYMNLRMIGVDMKSKSIRETLILLCDGKVIDMLNEGFEEELPGMGNFHDFGKTIEYGHKTKGYKHRTPDSIDRQQRIIFEDFDRNADKAHVEDWEGEHRGDSSDSPDKEPVRPFDQER